MEDNSLWMNVGDILSEEGVDGEHVLLQLVDFILAAWLDGLDTLGYVVK